MANAWFEKGAEKALQKQIDFKTDTIVAILVSDDYVLDLAASEFMSDLKAPAGASGDAIIGAHVALTGRTVVGRVFDADNTIFTSVSAGNTAQRVVIAKYTGTLSTSPLLLNIDEITYFPIVTSGADVEIQWSSGANKILKL